MIIKSLQICIATLLISAVATWASTPTGPARMQGAVKDSKGQPVAGAEVHIKAKDGSVEKIVRTDSNGEFGLSKLPVTDYEVVLFVNGQVKASLTHQSVFSDKPTKVDFKLTGQFATNKATKKHTHMVYVPAATGSNLGGHWVEVDDQTGAGAAAGADNLDHAGNAAIQRMQQNTGSMRGGGQ